MFSHLFLESGEDSRKITSCCNMQECTFKAGCIFYGECSILTQNEKGFCGVLECACNCQIKMYKVSNLSNFSPRLCLIPSICLPLSFAFLCESLFFLACSLFDFFFSPSQASVLDGKTKILELGLALAPHLCAFVWVFVCTSAWAWISRAVNMRLILPLWLRVAERSALFNCLQFGLPTSDKSKKLCQVSVTACLRLSDRSQKHSARFL